MSASNLEAAVGVAAAAVTTVLAVWTAVRTVGRPDRLRRDELLWREVLGVIDERDKQLIHALHRHTTAELAAQRLAPKASLWNRGMLVLGSVSGGTAGWLAAVLAGHLGASNAGLVAWSASAFLTLSAVALFFGFSELAPSADAHNKAIREVLEGRVRHDGNPSPPSKRTRVWLTICLAFSVTLAIVAATAAIGSVIQVFLIDGWTYPVVATLALLLYAVSLFFAFRNWRALVQEPPKLTLIAASTPMERAGIPPPKHQEEEPTKPNERAVDLSEAVSTKTTPVG